MKNLSTPKQPKQEGILAPAQLTEEDKYLDQTLRPQTWDDYIGQEKIKKSVQIIVKAAKQRKEPVEHLLFYGGSGLGKTTISHIISKELGTNIRIITGPALERVGDLAAILTNLSEGDVLFCDEIHRLNHLIEEFLYPAMEDFVLNLVLGKGPMARTMELKLPHFTLIGATTRLALISAPLRNRFGATFQLNFYTKEDIKKILERSSQILQIKSSQEALDIIAQCSRFTPRAANRILKRVRDFAQVEGMGEITEEITKKALDFLEIDGLGLEFGDRKILDSIITKFNGGPVGLQTLSAATSEEEETILDIYEPYLMQIGFLERTPKGRMATKFAYEHLNIKSQPPQNSLI
ncbi:MAG: Holliday junction ATP-dependent DNA helicase RuvB [Parcubacteria group bacterium GW2011_GWC2_39_11]|nr:MAG: Holliday junction ATP-dependent DNA helicase RuvB [Parcubacteria group bacterium GW2011_GWA2_38_27]KKQ96313.1 MAG: Holliday junction ATP-dependent DNA helicase RuvB [Parcubacteria group bacterium GW2011_GWC2_39_11]